jgi:hypothetical protein
LHPVVCLTMVMHLEPTTQQMVTILAKQYQFCVSQYRVYSNKCFDSRESSSSGGSFYKKRYKH